MSAASRHQGGDRRGGRGARGTAGEQAGAEPGADRAEETAPGDLHGDHAAGSTPRTAWVSVESGSLSALSCAPSTLRSACVTVSYATNPDSNDP